MPNYLITGVSRGIGFEILRQVSQHPENTVVGLVRDKVGTEKRIVEELGELDNVHIVQADLVNYDELKNSVGETSRITDGKLDYIIANAGLISKFSGYDTFSELGSTPQELEDDMINLYRINVIGQVHLFNLYMPLILKGEVKKVIAISTGLADGDLTARYNLDIGGPYSASKAALNLVTAKFSAEYSDQGVLFLSICPGMVDTGSDVPEEKLPKMQDLAAKFLNYSPNFKGPSSPRDSVKAVLSVVERASLEAGEAGAFLSHFGNKRFV